VAIRFALAPQEVSSLLVGARNPDQLAKNLNTLSLPPLDPDIIAQLKKKFAGRTEEFNPNRQGWVH
jgi:aryl-alcohol dehydrogenase-like predicted oxidoreductase